MSTKARVQTEWRLIPFKELRKQTGRGFICFESEEVEPWSDEDFDWAVADFYRFTDWNFNEDGKYEFRAEFGENPNSISFWVRTKDDYRFECLLKDLI